VIESPRTLPSLTVVFPCRNEAENLPALLERVQTLISPLVGDLEVIVVDDASTDGTPELLRTMGAADPRIRTVRHERCGGYGAALRTGFAAATKEFVFFTDGDGQFDLADFPLLVEALGRGEIAVGRRLDRRDNWQRRMNGAAWNWLVRRLFALPVRDVDCAFKLMPAAVVKSLPLRASGAVISTELLALATRSGCRIAEVGVRHLPRRAGRATGGDVRVILRAFRELLELRRRLRDESRDAARPPAQTREPSAAAVSGGRAESSQSAAVIAAQSATVAHPIDA
jgi:glycosyltransferase involved in cell wall biosynthesis